MADNITREVATNITGSSGSDARKFRLDTFLRRYKKPLGQILACGFIVNLFALCLPVYSSFVYDKILGNGITDTLWALVIGLVIVAVVEFSVRAVRALIAERFSVDSEKDIDRSVFGSLLSANVQTLPSVGRFLERYKRLLSCRDFLSSAYLLALADIPFLALFLGVMAIAAGPLVLIPAFFGLMMMAGNFVTSIPLFDYDRKAREGDDKRFRILTDVLASHEIVARSFWRDELTARWGDVCADVSARQSASRYWRTLGASFSGSMTFLSYVFVIVGGVYMIEDRSLTSGGLLAASMLASRAMAGFSSVIFLVLRYREFQESMDGLDSVLAMPKTGGEDRRLAAEVSGNIVLESVTCRLAREGHPVLSNVGLSVKAGEMVGIAGSPGAGKTTLLRLIAGVVDPEDGRVLIDHYPVRSLGPDVLASAIGYKPQDLCLLEGTIEENVRAGRPEMSAQDRERVLAMSGLQWAFQRGGLDWSVECGARGSRLSGGQKQLVALARAFLGRPSILLLDEPTNGLDMQLEGYLARQLAAIKGQSTVLISTHSRSLLAVCDRIVAIGNGRIIADGPREKILVA